MPDFTIDDVRESFTRDVDRLLGQIDAAARELLAARVTLERVEATAPDRRFRVIADSSHSIHGASGTINVKSLAESAKLLEDLAEQGANELRLATVHAANAQRIAELSVEASASMRAMLESELAARGEDAVAQSHELARRISALK